VKSSAAPSAAHAHWRRTVFLLVAVAVLVRLVFCWLVFPQLLAPRSTVGTQYYFDSYREIAVALQSGAGYRLGPDGPPALHRPPGYVLFLLACNPSDLAHCYLWVQLLHGLMGGLAALATLAAARSYGLSQRGALFAGWIVALWPFLIWETKVTVPETPLCTLVAATCWALARLSESGDLSWSVVCGALVTYAALTHPLYQILIFIAVLTTAVMRIPLKRKIAAAVVMVAIYCVGTGPWIVRNQRIAGYYFGVASGFGLHYWKGTYDFEALIHGRPYFRDNDVPATMWVSSIVRSAGFNGVETNLERSDPAINRFLDTSAMEHLRSHPIYTLAKIVVMMPLAWVHQQTPLRSACNALLIAPFFLLAATGLPGWRNGFVIVSMLLVVNAAAALVFVQAIPMRYMLPLVPLLGIMSGHGYDAFRRRADGS
jgi:dolichyl-phosphate-mannose-protein mannosyltransferase